VREASSVGLHHRHCAARCIGGGCGGDQDQPAAGQLGSGLGGIQHLAATHTDQHLGAGRPQCSNVLCGIRLAVGPAEDQAAREHVLCRQQCFHGGCQAAGGEVIEQQHGFATEALKRFWQGLQGIRRLVVAAGEQDCAHGRERGVWQSA